MRRQAASRHKRPPQYPLTPEVERILFNAEKLQLISLQPPLGEELGRTTITDPAVRQRLAKALKEDIDASGGQDTCWEPRHAIEAELGDQKLSLVICFECHWGHATLNGKGLPAVILFSGSAQGTLNHVLADAGIKIAD